MTGQDCCHALPGHQPALLGPLRDSGEAPGGQHRWTQPNKFLFWGACLDKNRERNSTWQGAVCPWSQLGPGQTLALLQHLTLPLFLPVRAAGIPWDPNPPSGLNCSAFTALTSLSLPCHPLYFTGWCLSHPIPHRRVQKWISPEGVVKWISSSRGGKKKDN